MLGFLVREGTFPVSFPARGGWEMHPLFFFARWIVLRALARKLIYCPPALNQGEGV